MSRKKRWQGPEHGGWTNISRGSGPYVSIYCRGLDQGPHSKWRIASLYPSRFNGETFWVENTSGYADSGAAVLFKTHPPITQQLAGDRWLPEPEQHSMREDAHFRLRWSIRCKMCGFSRVYARPLALSPRISQLALLRGEDGILELSVRAFASHLE